MNVSNALIVGAGMAGTTLAGELQRQGVQVHVVELEQESIFRGIGVQLLPPAVRCMHTLGVVDECLERGFAQYVTSTSTADGTLLARNPLEGLLGPEYPPSIGLPRFVLGEILRKRALEAGADLQFGTTVTALSDEAAGVDVEFSDGSSGRYDVVVGADGLRSAVRSLIFPDEPPPRYLGQCGWRVLVGNRPAHLDEVMLFLGDTTRAVLNPILPDNMYLSLLHQAEDPRPHLTSDQAYLLLMELLAEYGGPVEEAGRCLSADSPSHYGPLYATFRYGPWHRGSVILIGDAAHATPPHLGSGAAIAIEDAIVLARCLREPTIRDSFDLFMDQRYERCRMVIENSLTLSRWDRDPSASGHRVAALVSDTFTALARPI